jgi:hypothetical protein
MEAVAGTTGRGDGGRGDRPSKERKMTTSRVRERVEALRDRRSRATRAAITIAMVGLLVGLCAFFVSFAPHM